jgi:hypothetical protein
VSPLERARRLLDTLPPPPLPGQTAVPMPPARPRLVCDVPQPQHDGPVRPYHCGPRCDRHAPRARPPAD